MKLKNSITIVLVGVFMLTITSFKNKSKSALINQDAITINAVYDGAEDYGYNFIHKNDADEERTITFHVVAEDVLKAFDLKSEALIGTAMKVTYHSVIKIEKDENGYDDETKINTITKLEKIKK